MPVVMTPIKQSGCPEVIYYALFGKDKVSLPDPVASIILLLVSDIKPAL